MAGQIAYKENEEPKEVHVVEEREERGGGARERERERRRKQWACIGGGRSNTVAQELNMRGLERQQSG